MFTGLRFPRAHFGVLPTAPMDDEHDFAACVIDVDENLLDQRAHELLLDARIGGGSLPRCTEIDRQSHQRFAIRCRRLRHDWLVESCLASAKMRERGVPASLEL